MADILTNTELAILGLIAERPKYGYQVEQEIEKRGYREWTEIGFSSIYYVLNKMEGQGWLLSEKQDAGDRPTRKVYRLAPDGQKAYHDTVLKLLSAPRPRSDDFDLALANLPALTREEALQGLRSYAAKLVERLERVQVKWDADGRGRLPLHVDALFDRSILLIQTELNWVESWIERIKGKVNS